MTPPSTIFVITFCASVTLGTAAVFLLAPISTRYQTALSNQAQWTADSNNRQQEVLKVVQQAAGLAEVRPLALGLLPATNLQYDLVVQIEGLGRALSLPLTSLSVTGATAIAAAGAPKSTESTATTEGPSSIALTVGATGTYAQAVSLVQALPTISRSLLINQVVISNAAATKDASSTTGLVSVSISANAYYQPFATQKKL